MTPRKRMLVAVLVALALPAVSTSTLGASHGEVVEVHLVETGDDDAPFAFEPSELTIQTGTTVRWVNDEDVFHTVTFTDSNEPGQRRANGMFDETLASEGDSVEFTVEEPGTFEYFCKPHAGFMFASITVEGEPTGNNDAPFPGLLVLLTVAGAAGFVASRRF